MITNEGKGIIKRFFARQVPQIAGTMVFGTGITPETAADVALESEVARVQISSINADLDSNRIVFKASLQPGQIPTIYEVGLYSGIYFNGLEPTETSTMDQGNVLVARTVLATPVVTDPDIANEVEYSLEINIT